MVTSIIDKDKITTVERRNNEELRDLYVTSRLGQALEIKTLIENTTLSRQEYTYDRGNSNLSSRLIQINGGNVNKEEFEYDALDRLSSVKLNGSSIYSLKMSYDSKGNITGKTDISGKQMSYDDPNRPHAITSIVADDPLTYLSNQNIQYTFFDQPKIIQTGQNTLSFKYGSNNQRKLVESDSPWMESGKLTHRKYYFNGAEVLISPSGEQTLLKYITANGKLVAIVRKTEETQEIFYPILDRQGSIIAILNSDNEFVETRSYDAWGRLRNSEDWTDYQDVSLAITSRSYTGHEYLPDHKLINMNGRLYDPQLGRMLSPDMYVQNPGNSQNYNRYSYVLNNPLKYTDPSGELCQGCGEYSVHRPWDEIPVASPSIHEEDARLWDSRFGSGHSSGSGALNPAKMNHIGAAWNGTGGLEGLFTGNSYEGYSMTESLRNSYADRGSVISSSGTTASSIRTAEAVVGDYFNSILSVEHAGYKISTIQGVSSVGSLWNITVGINDLDAFKNFEDELNAMYGEFNMSANDPQLIPEVSSSVSMAGSIVSTEVSLAADITIKELGKRIPSALKIISKLSNGGGGILGIVDNGFQFYNDYQKGNYGRATLNGVQAGLYVTGTALLFTPAFAIGGSILLYTTISDWIQSGVEYGSGTKNY